jgi:hypothetical protein
MTTTPDTIAVARIPTRISDRELQRRWMALHAGMADRGVDALIVQNANDWMGGYVKYLTDLPANNGYPRSIVFPAAGPMTIVEVGPAERRRELDGIDTLDRGVGEVVYSPSFLTVAYTHDTTRRRSQQRCGKAAFGRSASSARAPWRTASSWDCAPCSLARTTSSMRPISSTT